MAASEIIFILFWGACLLGTVFTAEVPDHAPNVMQ